MWNCFRAKWSHVKLWYQLTFGYQLPFQIQELEKKNPLPSTLSHYLLSSSLHFKYGIFWTDWIHTDNWLSAILWQHSWSRNLRQPWNSITWVYTRHLTRRNMTENMCHFEVNIYSWTFMYLVSSAVHLLTEPQHTNRKHCYLLFITQQCSVLLHCTVKCKGDIVHVNLHPIPIHIHADYMRVSCQR